MVKRGERKRAKKIKGVAARLAARAALDAQYRAALGVPPDQPLPPQIGVQATAGAARGGRGAAQRGKGRDK